MSRLIFVSNRVNPPADPGVETKRGLAMALAAAVRDDKVIWFGWRRDTAQLINELSTQEVGGSTVASMDREERDRIEYYDR